MSSAAGVGGGSLYVPILNIVAGLSLKTSVAFSTFMVTGGTLSNVLYTLLARGPGLIDYDVAAVSQPCLLLGVSVGVVCNIMFPEWLITVLFATFLSLATFKTCGTGLKRWRAESAATARGPRKRCLLARKKGLAMKYLRSCLIMKK
ncbi:sulfite exporter TauE/SafE family protein 5-like [Triticum dicoccoides]|uniref:sulfite exporter TauE/SafE family protein 5-like n=1 Tax=Triticum dicoccoides TaxID=85692 RepID=UPI001891764E|nr:sulfite exporter TauE/SafE family protein 5-like [Triticum dicoccoides]